MLAPMLVQMERQIDREIAADQKKLGNGGKEEQNGVDEDSDSELEDEKPMLVYGPLPQIVTNDLKSLDEMVSLWFFVLIYFRTLNFLIGDRTCMQFSYVRICTRKGFPNNRADKSRK